MTAPRNGLSDIARNALAAMSAAARDQLLIDLLVQSDSIEMLTAARNAITDRAAELIADRYADTIIQENRYECVY